MLVTTETQLEGFISNGEITISQFVHFVVGSIWVFSPTSIPAARF